MAVVSLIKGDDRYKNVKSSLELIEDEIKKKVEGKKRIIIKPNFVSDYKQKAATHVDAVRAVLDIVTKYTNRKIMIAEGSAHETFTGFKNFGYMKLKNTYDVEFFDLNNDREHIVVNAFDSGLNPMKVLVSKTMKDADCRISVCPMKTHNEVVVTLSLKNVVVGSLLKRKHFPASRYIGKALDKLPVKQFKDYKAAIHQGYKAINKNIFEIAKIIYPHISVIDAYEAMEGEGPSDGDVVPMKLALSSTDFLAADSVACHLMGFDIDQIGYLYYCKKAGLGEWDLKKIKIVGNTSLRKERRAFKPHSTFKEQLKWK